MADGYYPPVGFHFTVEFLLDGVKDNDARFQEVSGLTSEITTEELKEGGENRFSYKLPNAAKFPNLVLKRGMLTDSGLIDWFKNAILNFEFKSIDINVSLLNEEQKPLMTWKFAKAYPIKWSVTDFKSQENSLVVETIEIAYQYFRKE